MLRGQTKTTHIHPLKKKKKNSYNIMVWILKNPAVLTSLTYQVI